MRGIISTGRRDLGRAIQVRKGQEQRHHERKLWGTKSVWQCYYTGSTEDKWWHRRVWASHPEPGINGQVYY